MKVTQELIKEIQEDYKFVGESFDKDGNFTGYWYLYSKTVYLFHSEIEKLNHIFPQFKIINLYNNYYVIGFNKSFL